MFKHLHLGLVALLLIPLMGCSDDGMTVIEPGGPYQPTPEEQKTIEFIESEMAGRTDGTR